MELNFYYGKFSTGELTSISFDGAFSVATYYLLSRIFKQKRDKKTNKLVFD